MVDLTERIRRQIASRNLCTVFQEHLEQYFPSTTPLDPKWIAAIEKFADDNGWEAKILQPVIRVTFRKKKP